MNEEAAKKLRAAFPPEVIGKLPRAGIFLDYVGHAAVTDRLLEVDPEWSWEPVAFDSEGAPFIGSDGKNATLWIRLTVAGTTRYGVGIVQASAFELEKQLISDALRNAAMRFGVALDLWSKQDLDTASAPAGVDPATGEVTPISDVEALKPRELHDALVARGLEATGSVPQMRDRLREFVGGAGSASLPPTVGAGDSATSSADAEMDGGASPVSATPDPEPYEQWSKLDLVAACAEREPPIEHPSKATIAELAELLHADDRMRE